MHEVETYSYKEETTGNFSMKNIIVEINNSIEGLNDRMDSAEEQTGKLRWE